MTSLYRADPDELAQYASRGDPPMSAWPGTWVNKYAVMSACGDERDWFRYHWRKDAYDLGWAQFCDARRRRRKLSSGFDWNQVLILGEYGAKKTTLGIKVAYEFFIRGHAVFSNASVLFGWHLEHEEMYTAMGRMPKFSVLLIDESSAALASRVGHGVAVSTFAEMNLNTRKKGCYVIYMTAHDWEMAANIRTNTKEVWKPLPGKDLQVQRDVEGGSFHPAMDIDNFSISWQVWDDAPYQKRDLIEGKQQDNDGFGPPAHSYYDEGENVRNAYLLNDTFELAKVGAATTADRDTIKGNIEVFLKEQENGLYTDSDLDQAADQAMGPRDRKLAGVFEYFIDQMETGGKEYYQAGDLARHLKISPQEAGVLINRAFPVQHKRNYGYLATDIFDHIENMEAAAV